MLALYAYLYVFKMKVSVNLEYLEEIKDFELPNDARIGALRKALSDNEGVVDPDERIRLYFKTTAGHNLGTYDSSCSSTLNLVFF